MPFDVSTILDLIRPWFAVLGAIGVGFIGSFGYVTALRFGFVGGTSKAERMVILSPFTKKGGDMSRLHVFWFAFTGGLIAGIFQYPEPHFVPIQSFILGATWPSIVSQLLSGR